MRNDKATETENKPWEPSSGEWEFVHRRKRVEAMRKRLKKDVKHKQSQRQPNKKKGWFMKRLEFVALCGKYLIDVNLALENDSIQEALQERDDEAIEYILKTEF